MKTTPRSRTRPSRLKDLLRHDKAILAERPESSDACLLIGLDEVGRGSLIGEIVGGAVCLPRQLSRSQKAELAWLDDSKKLTPVIRAKLSEAIHEICQVGIGVAEKEEVDRLNVHYASLLALHRALNQLCQSRGQTPETTDLYLIMDGRAIIPDFRADRQQAIVKGDGLSAAIAAASVVAKHYRDTRIKSLAMDYPGYEWEENMGYGTPAHIRGIRELGVTPLHRRNFKQVHEQLRLL